MIELRLLNKFFLIEVKRLLKMVVRRINESRRVTFSSGKLASRVILIILMLKMKLYIKSEIYTSITGISDIPTAYESFSQGLPTALLLRKAIDISFWFNKCSLKFQMLQLLPS